MAEDYTIQISQESDFPDAEFYVRVEGGQSTTSHRVHVSDEYHKKLTKGSVSARELVHVSLEFLLEREPNTSVLDEFSLPTIERYFPGYENAMQEQFFKEKLKSSSSKQKQSLGEKLKSSLPTLTFKGEGKKRNASPKNQEASENSKES